MFDLAFNTSVLASHTMPDLISDEMEIGIWCSIVPILTVALWGAKVTASPFRWQRVAGVTLGVFAGLLSLLPAVVISLLFLQFLVGKVGIHLGGRYDEVLWIGLIYAMTTIVSFAVSLLGRPSRRSLEATPEATVSMESLEGTLDGIERTIRQRAGKMGVEIGPVFDCDEARSAKVLTADQASRLAGIIQSKRKLQQSISVLHSDVAILAGRARDFYESIQRQFTDESVAVNQESTSEHGGRIPKLQSKSSGDNPYTPPGS
ncbi:MAG: hypothetical protein AAGG48_11175 [Planctomycetota bacterium]